ncbi:MAG: DUF1573 domain-containing protein [bacterium]|nr:DUF1573 domain-containing protein [bacterium]
MKSKTIIYSLIVLSVIIALFAWGYSTRQGSTASVQNVAGVNNSKNMLIANEKFYDFGAISMKNGDVIKEFIVSNPTDGDIKISKIFTSCMCTSAFIVESDNTLKGPFGMIGHGAVPPANQTIKAGEDLVIRAVFNPNAHGPAGVGKIDRFITLTDTAGGTLDLEIKATVTP